MHYLWILIVLGKQGINAFWLGAGSAVSSTIAFAGTAAIGKAAISYYVDGNGLEEAKKKFEEAMNNKKLGEINKTLNT